MSQLATKYEKVRAVGNMNVNARGDVIDNNNNIVKDNSKRVKSSYNKTVGKNPSVNVPKQAPAKQEPVKQIAQKPELTKMEQELFDEFDDDEDIKK